MKSGLSRSGHGCHGLAEAEEVGEAEEAEEVEAVEEVEEAPSHLRASGSEAATTAHGKLTRHLQKRPTDRGHRPKQNRRASLAKSLPARGILVSTAA